jgi:hypothetical protein
LLRSRRKGKKGSAPGEFDVPHTIVIDSRGRVMVSDRSNKRVQIFDQEGAPGSNRVRKFPLLN